MKTFLRTIAEQGTLSREEAEAAMHLMMRGEAAPEEMAGLLLGLRARGETLDELAGFTRVMRAYAVPVVLDDPHAIDVVGTGGDGRGTFNISTAAAFVCAGAGVTVAKHGNRSVSSKCGSADVLAALGVRTELGKEGVERCLREAGIAFLFAPLFHPAVRHVMPVRRALGVRTFFNILGPLCNPAGVRRYLVGAFSEAVARQMAAILAHLGADYALTVHAADGLDELSLSAPTTVFAYDAARATGPDDIATWTVTPEAHGLARVPLEALAGGDAGENAALIRAVLDGRPGSHRDVVLLNAAYALLASGRFASLEACFEAARESLDSGAARARLDALVEVSNAG
ncbi:anthranilate phosphoribosyltransferase [Rhodocaloribacter litoris]|uniref:anthranilate phosphoribosyltransferase n=1 Tax=Rhodocaloribacter litoris TaxID=2558931 RepID=UPI001422E7FD|nr:anthranilate phosphoribosyltransferase [Rhodocaloribacter litoris]QXD15763.1 anthranilate phosphoribosyltransferase [Rhodocaloribacter litoris]